MSNISNKKNTKKNTGTSNKKNTNKNTVHILAPKLPELPSLPAIIPTIVPISISQHTFTHICHISDLHIRPNKRHDEYRHVFEKLYDELHKLKQNNINAIIVCTGDIFENVNIFLPEQYVLCSELFTKLSDIFPLIVIAGNHDIKDVLKTDSISPSAYYRPNFYYLPKTGAYEYGDMVIVVNSLYDENHPFITRGQVATDKPCIALYHGTISGSTNDTGFTFTNKDSNDRFRQKSEFRGYDAVLLGDIHKMQSLSPTMYYSGSLIQQNFGESLRNHGFLLWDLTNPENINVFFHEIISDYGMVTLKIENNECVNPPIDVPKFLYLRCNILNTLPSRVDEIISEFTKDITLLLPPVCICIDSTICKNNESISITDANSDDIILRELKLQELDNLPSIIEIHNKYMEQITNVNKKSTGYFWYPVTLTFSNLFGYSGSIKNTIDFKTGVTSITGPNATGKTSIINILLFAIYGKLLYGNTQNIDILNNRELNGSLILKICHGNIIYTIHKTLTRHPKNPKNPVVIEQMLNYEFNNENILLNDGLAGEKLAELFGNLTDFHKCNIINSRDQGNDFFNLTPGNRIKYLKDIFQLNYFDELLGLNISKKNSIKSQLDTNQGEFNFINGELTKLTPDGDLSRTKINDELDTISNNLSQSTLILNNLSEEQDTLQSQYSTHKSQIIPVKESPSHLLQTISEIKEKYASFPHIYNINELNTMVAVKKVQIIDIVETESVLNSTLSKISASLKKQTSLPSISDKNKIYKLICHNETMISQINKKILNITNEQKKYIKFENITITQSESSIKKEISELQKQYKPKPTDNIQNIKTQINNITLKLKKYKNCDSTLNIEAIISQQATLTKELEIINTQIKNITIQIPPKSVTQYDVSKLEQYQKMFKPLHMIPEKKKLKISTYIQTQHELKLIIVQIEELQNKTLTNDSIEKYIILIDDICQKKSLPQKEFTPIKSSLLLPLKEILNEIKNDTMGEYRDELNELINKKSELTNKYNIEKNIIDTNENIDKLISENEQIEKFNNDLMLKINHCKLDKLNQDKLFIENTLTNVTKNYEYSTLTTQLELSKQDLSNIQHNIELSTNIDNLNKLLNNIKYNELSTSLKLKQTELEQTTLDLTKLNGQYDLIKLIDEKTEITNKLNIINKNKILLDEIEDLNLKIEYEANRQKVLDYENKLNIIESNKKLQIEMDILQNTINDIKLNITSIQNEIQQTNIKKSELQNALLRFDKYNNSLVSSKNIIATLEHEYKNLDDYEKLISPKGLQSLIIKKELEKLQITMNEILLKYTKYSIAITYINNNINIAVKCDGIDLKPNLLSAFESLILLTSFKRAISKHTNCTKSKLYIMDESLENMDVNNFNDNLPTLLNLIQSEYSHILLVSQRDIKHIICNEIVIKKKDGASITICKNF
jgi:DNA repair exonuclease SbcCD ATPase subunit